MNAAAQSPFALALPISPNKMAGTYTGAELLAPPTRATCVTADALPSRIGNHMHYRDGRITDLHGVPVAPPPPEPVRELIAPVHRPAPRPRPKPAHVARPQATNIGGFPRPAPGIAYEPSPVSYPGRTLAHLRQHGGQLMRKEITALFGLPPASFAASFLKAMETGLLVPITQGRQVGVALPPATTAAKQKGSRHV